MIFSHYDFVQIPSTGIILCFKKPARILQTFSFSPCAVLRYSYECKTEHFNISCNFNIVNFYHGCKWWLFRNWRSLSESFSLSVFVKIHEFSLIWYTYIYLYLYFLINSMIAPKTLFCQLLNIKMNKKTV